MHYSKVMHTIILIIILIVMSTICSGSYCHCLHWKECKDVENILRHNENQNKYIRCPDEPTEGYYCCPTPQKQTISEIKCDEFTKIPNFCPENPMVFNGSSVTPHLFPFVASIQLRKKSSKNSTWTEQCGGSLIDRNFVLTAAHCFLDVNTENTEINVVLASHYSTKTNNTTEEIRFNVTLRIHENYNSTLNIADIALLELHNSANINTKKIRPVCLPKTDGNEVKEFRSAGWGYVQPQIMSNELLQTSLTPITNITDCVINGKTMNTTTQYCTKPSGTAGDVCRGDSGGPLFIEYPGFNDCLFAVMGVVSLGNGCFYNHSRTMHTKVWHYREWIEKLVWPN